MDFYSVKFEEPASAEEMEMMEEFLKKCREKEVYTENTTDDTCHIIKVLTRILMLGTAVLFLLHGIIKAIQLMSVAQPRAEELSQILVPFIAAFLLFVLDSAMVMNDFECILAKPVLWAWYKYKKFIPMDEAEKDKCREYRACVAMMNLYNFYTSGDIKIYKTVFRYNKEFNEAVVVTEYDKNGTGFIEKDIQHIFLTQHTLVSVNVEEPTFNVSKRTLTLPYK